MSDSNGKSTVQSVREKARRLRKERKRRQELRERASEEMGDTQRKDLRETSGGGGGLRERLKRRLAGVDSGSARAAAKRLAGSLDTGNVSQMAAGEGRETGMFARAEESTAMGPPVDASLEPLTAPNQMGRFAAGRTDRGEQSDESGGGMHVDELVTMGTGGEPARDADEDDGDAGGFFDGVGEEVDHWFGGGGDDG